MEQAIALYEATLADTEPVLDPGHPMLATFCANLAAASRAV
jgi:hypothetical protein